MNKKHRNDKKIIEKNKNNKIIIISILLLILVIIISYNLYYKNINATIYKNQLKNDYNDIEYVGYKSCETCKIPFFDGACLYYAKKTGCFNYYYKSTNGIKNPDVAVFYNNGNVEIDIYSNIINKYGYKDLDNLENISSKRNDLSIYVGNINNNSMEKIYQMVNEIINDYKKDDKKYLNINISNDNYKSIDISNFNTNNKSIFKWDFKNDIKLFNPSFDDVKKIFNLYMNKNDSYNDQI